MLLYLGIFGDILSYLSDKNMSHGVAFTCNLQKGALMNVIELSQLHAILLLPYVRFSYSHLQSGTRFIIQYISYLNIIITTVYYQLIKYVRFI